MAKLTVKSEDQITGDMIRTVLANAGLNDLNPGSVFLTLIQSAAREDFEQYYQILQAVRNYNLDTTTGTDLDNRAFEYGLTRISSARATGKINILREASFSKIASTHYSGFRSRISGDTELFINDGSQFPTSGGTQTIILGRGTSNEEEVTYTPSGTNPLNSTNYYKITLDAPMSNDHALEESVILKQGNDINIPAGLLVRVPASGFSPELTFTTLQAVILLAGEESVNNVDVQAALTGTQSNVGVGSITGVDALPAPPFNGARAYNPAPFSTGRDRETDTALRNRIRSAIQAISQSTPSGITNAINGLVDESTSKRVVSSNIITPDNVGEPVKIYIDDGTGFEPTFQNQGQEVIVSAAAGGEVRLQLDLFPLVKAQVESGNAEPYDFSTNGLTLVVNVGNQSETLTFFTTDFTIPEAATAEEIAAAINNQSNLLEARTSQVGTQIVINAKTDENEEIQVVGGTANTSNILNFPTDSVATFYLYKNDQLLSKDGETALIDSANSAPFDFSGVDKTLSVVVDGKTANTQTITISESDFDSPAAASQASADQIAAIINAQVAGATAYGINGQVRLLSNTELSSTSKIKVNTSTANTILGFSTTEIQGKNQDYTLNPELGVMELTVPLLVDDIVTAGTRQTRAFLTSSVAGDYSFLGGESLDVQIDAGVTQNIIFAAGSNQSATTVAALINEQLSGGTATVQTVGLNSYIRLRTNSYELGSGSIQVLSSSTANSIFGFTEDILVENIPAHVAFQVAQNSGPYSFVEGNTLVVVLDNNPSGKTYVITMDVDSEVTSGTSTTLFASSFLTSIFAIDDELNNFYCVFKSGDNTITGTVMDVQNPTGSTFRYIYDTPPTNFEDFGAGDHASFSDLANTANNGNFLVTDTVSINVVQPAVLDRDLDNPSALTPSLGDRYLVAATAALTINANDVLDKDLSNPSLLTPSLGDRYIVETDANNTQLVAVLDLQTDSTDPGVTASHGNRYLINGTGLNDWAGHDQEIAEYNGVGVPGWVFTTPVDKDVVTDSSTGDVYQFNQGLGIWELNAWGGQAGNIAEYNGFIWTFTAPIENQVRNVLDEGLRYQYDLGSNTWSQNDWGGDGNKLVEWNGASWDVTTPSTNDTVIITDEAITLQYNGTIWIEFAFWVEVTNSNGVTETGASGTGLIGQRRLISDYNATTGAVTLATPVRATPSPTDTFLVIPGTRLNVADYFNNTRVTSLSTGGEVSLVEGATKVQIASLSNGSDGYVQITGGSANTQLQFSTTKVRGLQAYSYYVGLIKLVHKTIYGDETDLSEYPGVGAAGVKFQILPPTVQEISVGVSVTLTEGTSLANVENDVKSAVATYINSLGVGEEVIRARIIEAVIKLTNVIDVSVTTPSVNVPISANELARTRASIITVESV